jgi:hypothetical protein
MDDLTTLARQLVEAGAFRWQAGMLPMVEMPTDEGTTWVVDTRLDDYQPETARPADGAIPCLEDAATAALLAVQAMERGRCFEHFTADEYGPAGWRLEGERPEYATLGEAAARALLAIHNTKETT